MSLQLTLRNSNPRLDFETVIPAREVTALLGPSGCGKTSILRAIAGLLRPEHAEVRLHDNAWSDPARGHHLPTRLRSIGLVPQHYGLFPHLRALDNVAMSLQHLPRAVRREQALHCLRLVNIAELAGRYPRELSGGQRQRLALARAIAREPDVLLLDEPFSAVDRTTRRRLYVELKRLHQRLGATTVLVTHDLDEAAQLATHLCLVDNGRLLQSGPVREVLARPASEAAARLLDIPNIFDGRLERTGGKTALLHWGPYRIDVAATATTGGPTRWAVHPGNVLMIRPDKPWGEHLENPVPTRVADLVELGSDVLVWLAPDELAHERLQMRLPLRALNRYPLETGQAVTVCLRHGDILLFPGPEA